MALGSLVVLPTTAGMGRVALVFTATTWIVAGYRFARAGAFTQGCGPLLIRNPISSRSVSTEDIAGFELGRWGPFPAMGMARLVSGERLHIWGIQARNPTFVSEDAEAEALIEGLNGWLLACQGASQKDEVVR